MTGGELTRWTRSEVGPLDPATFVTPELVRYSSFDALQIPADETHAVGILKMLRFVAG